MTEWQFSTEVDMHALSRSKVISQCVSNLGFQWVFVIARHLKIAKPIRKWLKTNMAKPSINHCTAFEYVGNCNKTSSTPSQFLLYTPCALPYFQASLIPPVPSVTNDHFLSCQCSSNSSLHSCSLCSPFLSTLFSVWSTNYLLIVPICPLFLLLSNTLYTFFVSSGLTNTHTCNKCTNRYTHHEEQGVE